MSDSQRNDRVAGEHAAHAEPLPETGTEIDARSPGERAPAVSTKSTTLRWAGFAGGLVLALALYLLLPGEVPHAARVTAAIAGLMAVWWMTEALPIPATALVPLVAFPVLTPLVPDPETGEEVAVTVSSIGASYGSSTIFLFMGGFLIALAMQRWNLHRRIALVILSFMGERTEMMILGFMIATGFLSMWVSNTATAVLMLPIGLSVLLLVNEAMEKAGAARMSEDASEEEKNEHVLKSRFGTALMLGIAYAASIGSVGTIIGTPPNTFLVGYLAEEHGISIGFGQWMAVGVPLAIVMMAIAWFLLVKVLFKPEVAHIPGGRELIRKELRELGAMSTGEMLVLGLFVLAAASWILIPTIFEDPFIDDAGIGLLIGLLMFLVPGGAARGVRLLDWETAVKMPWGVLLLFGGGIALSSMFGDSGLTLWIGDVSEGLGVLPVVLLVAVFVALIIFLTEITSNTATAATFVPVIGGVALGIGADPLLLTVPVALAATFAFMLPVATPPNSVAYGTGYVSIAQMVRGGVWLNLIGIVLVTAVTLTLAVWFLGIQL
ncbi:SLC13 family permease [Brevibacterium litoralis]|uniref:SLC13 family permease n=1 Tax=Brevibacterium litoralis TaxID=3138935 RepID=UPI003D9A0DA9